MIGLLPETLTIGGKEYEICPDFRIALLIFEAYDDPNLSPFDKAAVMLDSLFVDPEEIPSEHLQEACTVASWFLDGGKEESSEQTSHIQPKANQLFSWTQDEQMIFSAINKVAGCEIRSLEFLHWWTFLGYFSEIGEGLFTTVISIRQKQAQRKPLEKWEKQFYEKNKDLVDIRKKFSAEEQAERDFINKLLG
ncbi:MAG: hypothetical protein J6L91_00525 [Clostridia bacterium]|nr:hypothetical protein [Clostridia bacterium]